MTKRRNSSLLLHAHTMLRCRLPAAIFFALCHVHNIYVHAHFLLIIILCYFSFFRQPWARTLLLHLSFSLHAYLPFLPLPSFSFAFTLLACPFYFCTHHICPLAAFCTPLTHTLSALPLSVLCSEPSLWKYVSITTNNNISIYERREGKQHISNNNVCM